MATILIVDDHVLNRDFLRTLLGYGGHAILEAGSGAEALSTLENVRPDLVIADILMPHMNGYEMVARIQADPRHAGIPVIIYTAAYHEHEASIIARSCGAGWVLPKPSTPEVILRTVHEALGSRPEQVARALEGAHGGAHGSDGESRFAAVGQQVGEYHLAEEARNFILAQIEQESPAAASESRLLGNRLANSLSTLQTVSLRLTSLIDMGIELASERDAVALVESGARVARKICGAEFATVGILDDSGSQVIYLGVNGMEAAARSRLTYPTLRSGVLGNVLERGVPRRVAGLGGDPQAIGLPASHPKVDSFLAVRIASPERTFGWLYLANKVGAEEFSEIDERVASTVAAQLAVSYGSVALVDQLQREMSERVRAQVMLRGSLRARTVLSECGHVLIHANDELTMLQEVCRKIVQTGNYRLAWIAYANEDGLLVPQAQADEDGVMTSFSPEWVAREHGWSSAPATLRQAVATVVPDVLLEPSLRGWQTFAVQRRYRSALSLPMMDGEGGAHKPFGVLTIYETEANAFDDDQIAMFGELANDIAYGVTALRTRIARDAAEQALRASEHIAQAAIDALTAHVLVLDESGSILMTNTALRRFAGADPAGENYLSVSAGAGGPTGEDAIAFASGIRSVLHEELTEYSREYPNRARGGELWFHGKVTRFGDDARRRVVVVHEDITERKTHESHIEYLATHDALTGLANRTLLTDRLHQSIRHAQRAGSMLGLLFLDLDRFKDVNDSFGHTVGDALLQSVASRLSGLVRSEDSLARLGGDEFVVLLNDVQNPQNVSSIAGKIMQAFTEPFMVEGRHLHVTTSIGGTIYPNDSKDISGLYRNADSAMYRAKEAAGNHFEFYSQDMSARATERANMERALRSAVVNSEFELHYQPKVSLGSGRVNGAEALLRWHHPELGMVPPDRFIPLAEETGMIVQIGAWVMRRACLQNKAWQDAGLAPLCVSVNLSARQFRQHDLVDTVASALRETGLEARYLELELTETLLMENAAEFSEKLVALKAMGVRLSIDDFGTGYSSLAYLKRFPVDTLKIDRAFIKELVSEPDDAAITRAVISLAHSLNLSVIAEGVETKEQLEFLWHHGCDEIQGYLFSRPLPAREFAALHREARELERF